MRRFGPGWTEIPAFEDVDVESPPIISVTVLNQETQERIARLEAGGQLRVVIPKKFEITLGMKIILQISPVEGEGKVISAVVVKKEPDPDQPEKSGFIVELDRTKN